MVLALVLSGVLVAAIAITALIQRVERRRIFPADRVPEAPWAIVLGAPTPDDGPAPVLEDRLLTATELYQRRLAGCLLLTGDDGRRRCNEVAVMRRFVLDQGVPEAAVRVDPAGRTTLESVRNASAMGIRRAIVVTQGFHLPRAMLLAQLLGIDVVGVAADRRAYVHRASYLGSEWLKTLPFAVRALRLRLGRKSS